MTDEGFWSENRVSYGLDELRAEFKLRSTSLMDKPNYEVDIQDPKTKQRIWYKAERVGNEDVFMVLKGDWSVFLTWADFAALDKNIQKFKKAAGINE